MWEECALSQGLVNEDRRVKDKECNMPSYMIGNEG